MTDPVAPPVPVALLTGFLGAGKTTLLNALLKEPILAGAAVVINEFGEIGIDHLLVEAVEGDMLFLTMGCICCSARGDLTKALGDLIERRQAGRIAFDRIVVETTGIADPGPIINAALLDPALLGLCRPDVVVTLIDASAGTTVLDRHPEAVRQAAVADVLVLSKTDLVQAQWRESALANRLEALNRSAPILLSSDLKAILTAVLDPGFDLRGAERGESAKHVVADRHVHGHHAGIEATSLRAGSVDLGHLATFIDAVAARCGPGLLRLKGIVASCDDPARPIVVQAVQHMVHPAVRLQAWPDADHDTRIVVITQDIGSAPIAELWASFFGPPAIDRPDAAALSRSAEQAGGLF